jgi:hypothetical protein
VVGVLVGVFRCGFGAGEFREERGHGVNEGVRVRIEGFGLQVEGLE